MSETEEELNPEQQWPEEHLRELFRILQPLCFKYIKATHLLPSLPLLRPHASKITKKERKSAPEATELLFEIIKGCDEPEKWKKFAIALKETDFLSLYKVCKVCEKSDFCFYIQIFEILSLDFAETGVKIMDLSTGMQNFKSLNQNQFKQINLVLEEEGEIAAVLEFISCLPSSLEVWLKNLQSCLFAIGKKDLCKQIKSKGTEIHVYNNIDLEPLVKIHYPKISLQVRPQDIIASLKPHDLIPDMNVNSLSPSEQMCRILDNIERSDVLGKWRSFLDALKLAGYESLHSMLNGGNYFDDSPQIELIRRLNLSESLDLSAELLFEVKDSQLITVRCYQEITQKKIESGNIAAAQMLLDNINKFKADWYNTFLTILSKFGQSELVDKIDPDFFVNPKGKVLDDEDEKVEGNNDIQLRVDLPVSTMGSRNQNFPKNEEELLSGVDLGKNCIIYIFTRRNALALEIIKMHLDPDMKRKVIFLGEPRSVNLQKELLRSKAGYQVTHFTNDGHISLEKELMRNQVVLLAPEDLMNSNLEKLFSNFSLLLIDDCHLTIKNHPFNELMKHYVARKLDNSLIPLPQVIGLTSFGHDKPKNRDQAVGQIKTLCANLDCKQPCTLENDAHYFACRTEAISGSQSDCDIPFKEKVQEIMGKIENHLRDFKDVIKEENGRLYVIVNTKNSKSDRSSYKNWLAELKKGFVTLEDSVIRFHYNCCWWFLNMLHNALEISTFCEIKHAFDYIKRELTNYKSDSEIFKTLLNYWTEEKEGLQMMSEKPIHFNHKLKKLRTTLEEEIKKNPWSKMVVIVQELLVANILLELMTQYEGLKSLLPSQLKKPSESNKYRRGPLFTSKILKEMFEAFNRMECQLIVVTLKDWKTMRQEYNLRLDYLEESIDDKFRGLELSEPSGASFNPELLLHQAMIELKEFAIEDSEGYQDLIRKIQRKSKNKEIRKDDSNQDRPLRDREFRISCKNCKEFVSFSSEIRRSQGGAFFSCSPKFQQRVHLVDKTASGSTKKTIECPKCFIKWGHVSEGEPSLLELHANSFSIVDVSGRTIHKNDWQSMPFHQQIPIATREELEEIKTSLQEEETKNKASQKGKRPGESQAAWIPSKIRYGGP